MSNTFSMVLRDAVHEERYDAVASFIGEDDTGTFGILAHHARFMTIATLGLARFQTGSGQWLYVALSGGLLYMRKNELVVCTRRFVTDADFETISKTLNGEFTREARELHETRESLRKLEEAVLKRLYELGRRDRMLT